MKLREAQFAVNRAIARVHFAQRDVSKYTALALKASVEETNAEEELAKAQAELAEARREGLS